jgi:hypothetical protein
VGRPDFETPDRFPLAASSDRVDNQQNHDGDQKQQQHDYDPHFFFPLDFNPNDQMAVRSATSRLDLER